MPNNTMEKKPISKNSEIVEQDFSSHDKIHNRKMSITEINARTHGSEEKVKRYGPNLLTGEGMDSKPFLEKLNSEERNRRPKWRKAWDRMPFTEGLNKETLVTEIQTKSKERIKRIRDFSKENTKMVEDVFGGNLDILDEYLEARENNIMVGGIKAIEASDQEDRRLAAEILAVEADRLQRLEWRLNHAGNSEDKGKETKENIQKAYDLLKNASIVDYRAFTVITDAVYESERRTKPSLEGRKKYYKKLYKSWDREANILMNMILKEDSSFKTYSKTGLKNKMIKLIEESKVLLQNDIENRLIDTDPALSVPPYYQEEFSTQRPPTNLLD